MLANDITAPIAIKTVREIGAGVFDRDKICLVPDHYAPNKDIKSAEQTKVTRDFAHEMGHHALLTSRAAWASSTRCSPSGASWSPETS